MRAPQAAGANFPDGSTLGYDSPWPGRPRQSSQLESPNQESDTAMKMHVEYCER